MDYLGRQEVDAGCAQDYGCTDEAVGQLCRENRLVRVGSGEEGWREDRLAMVGGGQEHILYSTCYLYSRKSHHNLHLLESQTVAWSFPVQ